MAAWDDEHHDVADYTPEDSDLFDEAEQFVKNREHLLQYFGTALWCQQKLARLLGPKAANDIQFPHFPEVVKPIDPGLVTFDEQQLKILDGYRAPQ